MTDSALTVKEKGVDVDVGSGLDEGHVDALADAAGDAGFRVQGFENGRFCVWKNLSNNGKKGKMLDCSIIKSVLLKGNSGKGNNRLMVTFF